MEKRLFTKTHEWILDEGDLVCVGITEHAQELLGDMVFVELPEVGEQFNPGDELGVVESVKAASDFYAPIAGEVVEVNEQLVSNPELVNSAPEAEGWLVKLKPMNSDRSHLLSQEQYMAEINE